MNSFSQPSAILIPVLLVIGSLVLDARKADAADLEVVESFWTDSTQTQSSVAMDQGGVEVSTADTAATFAVNVINRRGEDITAIRATIGLPDGIICVKSHDSQATTVCPGITRAGEMFTLLFPVEITSSYLDKTFRCSLVIDYSAGSKRDTIRQTLTANLRMTGDTNLELTPINGLSPGSTSALKFRLSNRGTASATGIRLSLPGISGMNPSTQQPALSVLGQRSFKQVSLSPGQSVDWETSLYVNPFATGSLQSLDAEVRYTNACLRQKRIQTALGVSIFAAPNSMSLECSEPNAQLHASAGKISALAVEFCNRSGHELSDVSASVRSGNDALNVMGQRNWMFDRVDVDGIIPLTISVFAAKELMGRVSTLGVSFQFVVDGQPHAEMIELSLYSEGEILVRLNDVEVGDIASVPHLTGNLLNEGVGTALFSTLEVIDTEGNVIAESIYLGDLVENSPIPFSIPLGDSFSHMSGDRIVRLRLSYQDALRNPTTKLLQTTVSFTSRAETATATTDATDEPYGNAFSIFCFVAGIGIGFLVAILLRRKHNAELQRVLEESKRRGDMSLDEAIQSSALTTSEQ
ncbi:hypothetical protein [Stieleria varia]|uniref:Uncharacterized protein n=1 Tax=Stieleria varia TaxID=2528005 RepID=A0A5C6B2P5_9BACT|nr:hypothetical protein [Stieleria varia]TWU06097.1 hypothetical protein Pla52n_18170 [Stieleria varia]